MDFSNLADGFPGKKRSLRESQSTSLGGFAGRHLG
jgi:hypothetical protein